MLLVRHPVSKRRAVGRPAAFDVGSKAIRLPEDLAGMILWLASIEDVTAAQIIDPLVRPVVVRRYTEKYAAIRAIKKAKDDALALAGKDPTPPLPEVRVEDAETGQLVTLEELHSKPAADPKKKPKK
jgi:hypothetical protein